MQNIIGSAGMLRGWACVWTMQMLWLFASLTVSVGAVAVVEQLITWRDRQRQAAVPPLAPVVAGYPDRPLG